MIHFLVIRTLAHRYITESLGCVIFQDAKLGRNKTIMKHFVRISLVNSTMGLFQEEFTKTG